jgi:Protein of unknown function (DUF2934)
VAAKKTSRLPKASVPVPHPVPEASAAEVPKARPRQVTARAAKAQGAAKAPKAASSVEPKATPPRPRATRKHASPKTPAATPVAAPEAVASLPRIVTDEDIRVHAYFLSIEHRGQGSPDYFWMLAERELRQRSDSK